MDFVKCFSYIYLDNHVIFKICWYGELHWFFILGLVWGLSWWLSRKRIQLQCRTHRTYKFDPWVWKIPWSKKWQLLQDSCLENAMDRGAWRATGHGVTKSRTQLSNWAQVCWDNILSFNILLVCFAKIGTFCLKKNICMPFSFSCNAIFRLWSQGNLAS